MHAQPTFSLQPLESRRLLHAGPANVPVAAAASGVLAECPEVVDARAAFQDAVKQLNTDERAARKTIRADRAAIMDEMKQLADDIGQQGIKDALAPLKEKLHTDTRAKNKEFRAAYEELRIAKRKGRQLLAADLKALHDAKEAGDQDAIDAAQEKLAADKTQIQEDLKPVRDSIKALADKWRPILKADNDAVQAKLEELNPDLKPLFDKLDDDLAALATKVESDRGALTTAQADLKTAIADCLAEHPAGHASA
jgi:uncharacterized phage infection (PIP) family protein YhgE